MLRHNAKIDLLREVPLFSACSKRQLGEIATIANEIDLAPGQVLIREGQPGRQFFVIIDGSVEVTKETEPVEIRGGTEFFGEMALLSSGLTNATVTATSAGRALAITAEDFQRLLQQSPEIEAQIRHSLEQRLAPEVLSGLTFWMEQAPTEFTPTEPPPNVL